MRSSTEGNEIKKHNTKKKLFISRLLHLVVFFYHFITYFFPICVRYFTISYVSSLFFIIFVLIEVIVHHSEQALYIASVKQRRWHPSSVESMVQKQIYCRHFEVTWNQFDSFSLFIAIRRLPFSLSSLCCLCLSLYACIEMQLLHLWHGLMSRPMQLFGLQCNALASPLALARKSSLWRFRITHKSLLHSTRRGKWAKVANGVGNISLKLELVVF